jgi:acyl carrier protein
MDAKLLLVEILHQGIESVSGTTALNDLAGWDSLKMVNLVVRLEEVLGRELKEPELESLNTVGDLELLLKAS